MLASSLAMMLVGFRIQLFQGALQAGAIFGGLNRIGRVTVRKYSRLRWRSFSSSSLVRMGVLSLIWRQFSGRGSSRFCSEPIITSVPVTSSSRMASMGGLVTWANSCWK
jgi:hypothetical protein